jgi:hypothetical protein
MTLICLSAVKEFTVPALSLSLHRMSIQLEVDLSYIISGHCNSVPISIRFTEAVYYSGTVCCRLLLMRYSGNISRNRVFGEIASTAMSFIIYHRSAYNKNAAGGCF